MTTAELVIHSHAMDELLAKLRQVEQERDEAKQHLQACVNAWESGPTHSIDDAIHHAAIYLKGGI